MQTPSIGMNLSFGRIALKAGLIKPDRLEALLIDQDERRKEGERYKIGELCQRNGDLTSGQVQKILLAQEFYRMRQDDELLAAVLERDGVLDAEVLQAALKDQLAIYRSESRVPESLGEMLVAAGTLDAARLQAVRAGNADLARAALRGKTEVLHVPERLPEPGAAPTGWLVEETGDGRAVSIATKALLGRDPANEVALEDDRASRQHARIDWRADQQKHVLTDLHSINGTWVNGQRVKASAVLRPGDRIRIGDSTFLYDRRGPDRATGLRRETARRAIPDTRKHLTVHARAVAAPPEEEIPVAEVVTPSPISEVVPFSEMAGSEADASGRPDVKAELRKLVDLKLAGELTQEEYLRRRHELLSRL
ncbi:MAG: FHA domain-containing protein [Planctomycetota bacterium]